MRHTVPTPAKRCRGMKNAPDAMSGAHKAGAEAPVLLGAAAGGSGEADGADGQQAERCRLWRFHFRRYMHGKSIGNAGIDIPVAAVRRGGIKECTGRVTYGREARIFPRARITGGSVKHRQDWSNSTILRYRARRSRSCWYRVRTMRMRPLTLQSNRTRAPIRHRPVRIDEAVLVIDTVVGQSGRASRAFVMAAGINPVLPYVNIAIDRGCVGRQVADLHRQNCASIGSSTQTHRRSKGYRAGNQSYALYIPPYQDK